MSPLSGSQLTGLVAYFLKLDTWSPMGFCGFPFYLGYSPIELWDSLSAYVHHGIACLASQASDWPGAFWASLSGFQSSVTLVKLLMIGHCLWPLGWRTKLLSVYKLANCVTQDCALAHCYHLHQPLGWGGSWQPPCSLQPLQLPPHPIQVSGQGGASRGCPQCRTPFPAHSWHYLHPHHLKWSCNQSEIMVSFSKLHTVFLFWC